MSGAVERIFIDGEAGEIETAVDRPKNIVQGSWRY